MKAKTVKAPPSPYLFTPTMNHCVALLAVKGDLSPPVSATPYPVC